MIAKYDERQVRDNKINMLRKLLAKNNPSLCYGIGDIRIGGDNSLYKYMTIKTALICFGQKNGMTNVSQSSSIMFQEPSQWKDQYESRFYGADFSTLPFYVNHSEWVNLVYACCFSTKSQNEAAWKMYSSDSGNDDEKYCVKLKLNRSELRFCLNNFANENDMSEYEGRVSYNLSNYTIEHLHQRQVKNQHGLLRNNKDYLQFFAPFSFENYLRLLLIKRSAFKHEEEYRIFLVPNQNMVNSKRINKCIFPNIEWKNVISEIEVDGNTPDYLFTYFVQECRKLGLSKVRITKNNIYSMNCGIIIER